MAGNSDELHWRETYFILFPHDRRPTLAQVAGAITEANGRYRIENRSADDGGMLESLLVESMEDHAAVEISYEVGDAVIEQNLAWAKEFESQLSAEKLQSIILSDARLDLAHYERLPASSADTPMDLGAFGDDFAGPCNEDEDAFNMLDPTCILTVVDALEGLTGGLTFDPAAGEIIT
ncbi:MAG: hypothetical protein MK171_11190 [Pirellulales bacterium]|nr:hypothetical protein [Pirellulales bacterium]